MKYLGSVSSLGPSTCVEETYAHLQSAEVRTATTTCVSDLRCRPAAEAGCVQDVRSKRRAEMKRCLAVGKNI